jgi:carbonic anhydrase
MRTENQTKNYSFRRIGLNACVLASLSALHADPVNLDQAIQAYRDRQTSITSAEVLDFLKQGNERFAAGISNHGGYPIDATERRMVTATGQRPIATVLSCIDARTTPELVFDTAVGDLFTARVGANTINDEILGSLEIASDSGSKVLVVLGHTDCGGIKAACSNLDFGHFTQIVNKIQPAIAAANALLDADEHLATFIGPRDVSNRRYVAHVSHANAAQSVRQILEQSPIIKGKVDSGEIIVVPALYDVDTGKVTFN